MLWVVWRHHRVALAGVAGFLGLLGLWLWITGLSLHHEYAAAIACRPAGSANCINLGVVFDTTNGLLKGGFILQPIPALIGAFVGPAVLAREFETGTFRFAWTQGIGRWRWAVAKLVALGVAVAVLAGAFSVLLSWYYQPYVAAQSTADLGGASPLPLDCSTFAVSRLPRGRSQLSRLASSLACSSVESCPRFVATLAVYTGFALVTANVLRALPSGVVALNPNIPDRRGSSASGRHKAAGSCSGAESRSVYSRNSAPGLSVAVRAA